MVPFPFLSICGYWGQKRRMKSTKYAKNIAHELDVSRPVTVLMWKVAWEIVDEVCSRVSPTSRMLVVQNAREELAGEGVKDERVEIVCGGGDDLEAIMREKRIEAFDGAIVQFSEDGERSCIKLTERIKNVLKPQGQIIAFPCPVLTKIPLSEAILWEDDRFAWCGLIPVRIKRGKRNR